MRRFFISGFERLLNVLTILAALAIAALAGRIAVQAQGDTQQYLTAAAVLLAGWLAVVAIAGISHLMIGLHDNSRRLIALAGRTGAARPLRATRTLQPMAEPEPVDDLDDLDDGIVEESPARPVFSGRAMPRISPAPLAAVQPAETAKAPVDPAPPVPVSAYRSARLVADRRPPR